MAFICALDTPMLGAGIPCLTPTERHGLAAGLLVSFRLFGGLRAASVVHKLNTFFVDKIGHLGPLPGELAALGDVREAIEYTPLLGQVKVALELPRGLIEAYRQSIFKSLDDC
ncbi:hypothetical protein LQW54_001727 [Pestalotiopsis sp. IQ-011]